MHFPFDKAPGGGKLKSMKTPYAKQSAFTIVELLIVIVVVGILATISVVAYTGIKNKALDTRVREGATQFEKALKLWAVEYGNRPLGGNGSTIAFSGRPMMMSLSPSLTGHFFGSIFVPVFQT
jgi:prepilin-type N-terminal cleavage/methylation domain-containing protein